MKIHLIACGGAVMHNLTIALHKKGYRITGSDDEIFDPAKSRLQQFGLLPAEWGWFPEKLSSDIDAVILGMHARRDNPELIRALELGLKVYSFPEYLYEQTKHKKRIVIGGSHGKTSVTSMIMHVMKNRGLSFDYMVGANIEGFETMVNLDENNSLAVFEGDEYLSSPIDLRPKFHWYRPHIAVLTGVAWDHINVFPTFGDYLRQFSMFVDIVEPGGCLIYYKNDENLYNLLHEKTGLRLIPYSEPESIPDGDGSIIKLRQNDYAVSLFGKHNMQNINAARLVCNELGISNDDFFSALAGFKGAAKRLQRVAETMNGSFFIDFAHAPSKLKATAEAVKSQYPGRQLVACIELHTFSSLNKDFLPQYANSMDSADIAVVYFNNRVLKHKKLEALNSEIIANAFGREVLVFTDSALLQNYLMQIDWLNKNLLMMSSGNFDGINFDVFARNLGFNTNKVN